MLYNLNKNHKFTDVCGTTSTGKNKLYSYLYITADFFLSSCDSSLVKKKQSRESKAKSSTNVPLIR